MRVSFSSVIALLILLLVAPGCARSTIDSRKRERSGAYTGLPAETQQLVDQGQIKIGMTEDAVYIAWGQPEEILLSESEQGALTTWLYHGAFLEQYRYWRNDEVYRDRRGYYSQPYLAHDYRPRSYVTGKVEFRDGKVIRWQTLPRPH